MSSLTERSISELLEGQWPGEWGESPSSNEPSAFVYRSTELDNDGHVSQASVSRKIPRSKFDSIKLRRGDLLLEASGGTPGRPVGRVGLYSPAIEEDAVCSNFIRVLRPKPEIDSRYLTFVLVNLHKQSAIWKYQQQTTGMSNLNVRSYLRHKLRIAEYPDQVVIAEILSTVDEAIEQTEALIAKTQAIKAGLMHDLFTRGVTASGQLRPPREQAPELYKESPIGWIPKEWQAERLALLLNIHGGKLQTGPFGSQLHASEYVAEGVPVVMPQDINDGLIDAVDVARITIERSEMLSRHKLKVGDVIIARRGDLSRGAEVTEEELGWICGTGCFILRLSESNLDASYFSLLYREPIIQRQIAGMAVGSTMPSLNNSIMGRLYIPFCAVDEQREIANRTSSANLKILELQSERTKLNQLQSGLMMDMLNG